MLSLKERAKEIRDRLRNRRAEAMRPLDEDDRDTLYAMAGALWDAILDGHISDEEIERIEDAWRAFRKARANTPKED